MKEVASRDRQVRTLSLALLLTAIALTAAYTVGVVLNHSIERSGWVVEALES